MKKYIIYLSVALLGLSLTSCEDFLKEEAFGNPTTEELMKDPENMSKLVGQAYAELKWLHDHWGYWGLNTLTSDEARCPVRNPGNNWDDSGYWASLNTMDWDYSTLAFELVWERCIAGATLCNKILKQLEPYQNLEAYPRFEAELAVLRTYYYYTMFDMFGRLPYTEEFPTSESVQFPLNDRQYVWQQMVNCLKKYTHRLPLANDPSKAMNYGRVTQGVGYALLARLYFNAASFDVTPDVADAKAQCVIYCDSIINSHVYHCENNYFNNFLVHNENSEENIFVIVENGNASFDYQDVAGKMCNKLRVNLLTQPYAFQTYYDLLEKPWNGFAASPEFLALYEEGDKRGPCGPNDGTDIDFQNVNTKFGWFLGPVKSKVDGSIVKDENGAEVIIVNKFGGKTDCSWHAGARSMKYETEVGSTVNKYMENDFVLLRYADILLMKAEAGGVASVASDNDFILIRTRVGLEPLTASATEKDILDERGRELSWENTRRRDLIRHNLYTGDAYVWTYKNPATESYKKWFPIPKKYIEMHANDKEPWKQNEGYLQ